jgi:NADPH-dependent FMN reductase
MIPLASVDEFSLRITRADTIIIVTSECSSGYPGVLKNALDYLKDEYRRKPFGIITISSAWSAGIHCLASLRQVIFASWRRSDFCHSSNFPRSRVFLITKVIHAIQNGINGHKAT